MDRLLDHLDREKTVFVVGLGVFCIMAGLGWNKLYYGFNFIDEGMYMVDGWRLTVGDRLFPDSPTSVTMMYSVLNAGIFSLFPDITLLSFRKLQFVLTLVSVAVFGLSVYRWSREYWYAPFVTSIFAFTGLDTLGMSANLSYYTYPHLFITLHVATLLFALKLQGSTARNLLLLLAGVFLWAVGFSLLPLSLGVVSPLLIWVLLRRADTGIRFDGRDAFLVMLPAVILWFGFLAAYNVDFVAAMSDSLRYVLEGGSSGLGINTLALQYLAVTAVFLVLMFVGVGQKAMLRTLVSAALAAVMFFILETNFFGFIPLFWRGWFAAQMWFSALLIVSMTAFFAMSLVKKVRTDTPNRHGLLIIMLVPSAIFAVLFSNYSGMGILSASYVSIPAAMGIAMLVVGWRGGAEARLSVKAVTLIAVFFPFYHNLAWADWRFTYFDVPPSAMTGTISKGFGAGIKTNSVFRAIIEWMGDKADQHSDRTDLAIILDQTPMGYMLIKRRPALNHSYTGWGRSPSLRRESVAAMIREQRFPKVAFRFMRAPLFFPTSLKAGTFALGGRRTFKPDDPVSNYLQTNMVLTDKLRLLGEDFIEFYVHRTENTGAAGPDIETHASAGTP